MSTMAPKAACCVCVDDNISCAHSIPGKTAFTYDMGHASIFNLTIPCITVVHFLARRPNDLYNGAGDELI